MDKQTRPPTTRDDPTRRAAVHHPPTHDTHLSPHEQVALAYQQVMAALPLLPMLVLLQPGARAAAAQGKRRGEGRGGVDRARAPHPHTTTIDARRLLLLAVGVVVGHGRGAGRVDAARVEGRADAESGGAEEGRLHLGLFVCAGR